MNPSLEFRIPIAPTPAFYSNARLAVMSLARLGEPYASAPVIISVGYDVDRDAVLAANPWSKDYPVVWHIIPPKVWGRGGFEDGLIGDRFPKNTASDIVVHCDADSCVVGRFDALLDELATWEPRAAGCIAHLSPFAAPPAQSEAYWADIFEACGVATPVLDQRYSMAGPEVSGLAPAYLNAGFVAMNRAAWEVVLPAIDRHTPPARALLRRQERGQFAVQVAMAVALAEQRVGVKYLGLEYNCPNENETSVDEVEDIEAVKVIHYLRTGQFDRHGFLVDDAAVARFLAADLKGAVNLRLQAHVRSLFSPRDAEVS